MPALIDLRKRIKSVQNTQKITQAMKTVSTAKFQKAQRVVLESRPQWHGYPELLFEMDLWAPASLHPLLEKREEKRLLGLVVSSDKGLAGAFNSNLLEKAHSFFIEKAKQSEVRLILIGKKAVLHFKRTEFPVERSLFGEVHKFTDQDMKDLAQFLIESYIMNRTDAIYAAYNEFKSILAPRVTLTKLLPFDFGWDLTKTVEKAREDSPVKLEPDWDPDIRLLLNTFLPQYILKQIKHYFFESAVSEHAARMMAMDNATKNAEDLISDLTLGMNKIRQASITKELLEIMSAVEALAKK